MSGDDLGHGPGLDRVPQFDHREPGEAVVREAFQLGDEVLAQRAAGAVVHQRRLAPGDGPGGVPYEAEHGAVGGRGEVVVERHAPRDGPQEAVDDLLAGLGVEPGDDHDGEFAHVLHQRAP